MRAEKDALHLKGLYAGGNCLGRYGVISCADFGARELKTGGVDNVPDEYGLYISRQCHPVNCMARCMSAAFLWYKTKGASLSIIE